jgi:hypothetical protein
LHRVRLVVTTMPDPSLDRGYDLEVSKMTAIGARVVAVDNLGGPYRVIVRIGFPRYRGSFYTLKFGENKPFMGFTHNGLLDLVYHEDPHLEAGQAFPLWTIQ